MARTKMRKEVTFTTVKMAEMIKGEDGQPKAQALPDKVFLGNLSLEKAQKEVAKDAELGSNVTVFEVLPDTQVYEMNVLDFVEHATLIVPNAESSNVEENQGYQDQHME